MNVRTRTRPTVRLRRKEWDRRMTARGLVTIADIAEHIDMSRATVIRIYTGEVEPGERFIAAALWAEDDAKFEELFEVVAERITTETVA